MLVCWDTGGIPTYRNELWPDYQTGREFDPEIVEQLAVLPQLVEALGFSTAKHAGYEADDLLASAAMAESMDGGTALVATSDRDAYQLVSHAVTVLAPQTGGKPPARIDSGGGGGALPGVTRAGGRLHRAARRPVRQAPRSGRNRRRRPPPTSCFGTGRSST